MEVGPDSKPTKLLFLSCFAYFEAEQGRWKLGKAGSPELWFFLGTVSPPPSANWASQIQTFFDRAEEANYKAAPQLGGAIADYSYRGLDGEKSSGDDDGRLR